MKQIIKFRWFIALLWVLIAGALLAFGSNLSELVAEKGHLTVPKDSQSHEASELLQQMSENSEHTHKAVVVFHEDNGLTDAQQEAVGIASDIVTDNVEKLAI